MPHTVQPRDWEFSIGISEAETVFGQEMPPMFWVPGSSSIKQPTGLRKVDRPTGVRARTRYSRGPFHPSGGLELEIAPGREQVIKNFLGMKTRRLPKTFTVYDVAGDQVAFANAGIAGNTVSIKCSVGEDLIATVDTIGRTRRRLPSPPPIPLIEFPAPYVYEEGIVKLNNNDHFDIEDFEVSDAKQLKEDRTGPGSYYLREIPSDGWEVTVKLAHAFEHDDLWDAAMAGEVLDVLLRFSRDGEAFVIHCPRCVYDEGDSEKNMQPLELTALASADGSVDPVIYE